MNEKTIRILSERQIEQIQLLIIYTNITNIITCGMIRDRNQINVVILQSMLRHWDIKWCI